VKATSPGKIITFYSYKGGTGRSMALANVAWILASNGKRVLVLDWDLEAPGLHTYFYPFLVDKELTDSDGIIDFVIDFALEAMTLSKADDQALTDWYKPYANILRYAAALDWDFGNGGMIDFVPAGRQGPPYSARVNSFNWQDFYDRLGGGAFLEAAKEKMREAYDYILIDSRTGVSDTSGICTVQMPDVLVACFTLNNQSIEGAAAVVNSVHEQRRESGLQIFPVPTRIENAEKEKLDLRWEYAKRKFAPFSAHMPSRMREPYWSEVAVPYVPYYAYEEILATFGEKHRRADSLLAPMEKLTAYLIQGSVKPLHIEESMREKILAQYEGKAVVRPSFEQEALDTSIGKSSSGPRMSPRIWVGVPIVALVVVLALIGFLLVGLEGGAGGSGDATDLTEFTITDRLGPGQITDTVTINIDDKNVGTIMVNQDNPKGELNVSVSDGPGTYNYTVLAITTFPDSESEQSEVTGTGQGTIEVSEGKVFEVIVSNSSTWQLTLEES
jgi:cellulose biosynthesis protein BcsQ